MDVSCQHCQANFKIPDEKVPKGQAFSLPCPKCKQKISIDPQSAAPPPPEPSAPPAEPEPAPKKTVIDEVDSDSYDASDKPFDFVEEGTETALLCEPDQDVRAKIRAALDEMGYHTTEATTARDALKQMRFHEFHIVVLNENFDTRDPDENNLLRYLNRLAMDVRRNMFVALITKRFRTMDNMSAFHKSVNMIINLDNIDDFEKVLKRGVADNEMFYRVYKESLVKMGRA
ncbi:zinc-ribbon domain-containing protein [Thermodesulfobacteriota bacterium]